MRLIDAEKLEELCDIMAEKCGGSGESIWNQFRTTVELSPTIEAEPVRRGRWIYGEEGTFGNPYGHYDCSECGRRLAHRENYCPDCGARMESEEEE